MVSSNLWKRKIYIYVYIVGCIAGARLLQAISAHVCVSVRQGVCVFSLAHARVSQSLCVSLTHFVQLHASF